MKFNVAGKAFQQQLQAVSKVINSKNTLSILDNFLLRVEGNILTIVGADSENLMKASMEVLDSESDGAIAVSAKMLMEVTKEISNQPISFSVNEETQQIDVSFLNGQFNFSGINAAEYPDKLPEMDNAIEISVPAEMVKKGIDNTLYAVSQEPIRPMMTGIFWDIHNDDITFVASDTHKLVKYVNTMAAPGVETSFIMPAKPAAIIRNIISKEDGPVSIVMDSKSATFRFANYEISCRFIKGNYPNYNRVIPSSSPFVMNISREALLIAMRRVAIFANKASNLVKFTIAPTDVLLEAQDLDYQTSAKEKVPCQYEGNEMTIGFNAGFTVEILSNIPGDDALIQLSDPARPGIFAPAEQQPGENLVIVQMPLQVFD